VAPGTAVEEMLVEIWARLLRIERVGIKDNFFALGGHSLLATQVISRIRAATGIELPLRAVFEGPTIAEVAARVSSALLNEPVSEEPELTRIPREAYREPESNGRPNRSDRE
jgi:acyl carrier protein